MATEGTQPLQQVLICLLALTTEALSAATKPLEVILTFGLPPYAQSDPGNECAAQMMQQ